MRSELEDFKSWLQFNYHSDRINVELSNVEYSKIFPQKEWKIGHLAQLEESCDKSIFFEESQKAIQKYSHKVFERTVHSLHKKISIFNSASLLDSVRKGAVSLPNILTQDSIKKAELETIYQLLCIIKNYFLFVEIQIKLLPKHIPSEKILDEVEDIFDQLNETKAKFFEVVVDIKMKLKKYPEQFLKNFGDKFLLEMKINQRQLEGILTLELFQRNVFREADAEQLKMKYLALESDFESVVSEETRGCFYQWCPLFLSPLARAKQDLSKIKTIDIEDGKSAYAVLAIFMNIYQKNKHEILFKNKMEQCFENALLISVKSVSEEMQWFANRQLEKYQEAETGKILPSIEMSEMKQQGYRLLKS